MTAKYIFWDCDSTLLDNAELHWQKHLAITSKYGLDLAPDYRERFYHNNGAQNWKLLNEELGFEIPTTQYLKEIDDWYHSKILEIPLRPGVAYALDFLKRSGARQCVVTNARTSSVRPMIENKGLLPYFEFVWCKEDYKERKPHPTPYLTAHARMENATEHKIDKSDCIAIEDDAYGVTAASAAGIPVIHRRLRDDVPPAPEALTSVYTEADFLKALLGEVV
ncbi:MAG TPA: HAD family phosphatase [Alphaproteobacteria bacterium]|nr:HAD family phosphatase [Alphaproteobacteria bacterium]HNS44299.1 HAD family phosphatase [Alphaproteobacteria bacterium]